MNLRCISFHEQAFGSSKVLKGHAENKLSHRESDSNTNDKKRREVGNWGRGTILRERVINPKGREGQKG